MKLLIVYGTTEGQTRKIAEFLKAESEKQGVQAAICDTTCTQISPDGYDAVIICSSMHMHKYQTSINYYIKTHFSTLNDIHSAFCSVSLSAVSKGYDEESYKELTDLTSKFLLDTGWKPQLVEYAAGALRYTEYDFFKKFIMRQIAQRSKGDTDTSHDHEYTNWDQLRSFLNEFLLLAKTPLPTLAEEIL